MSDIDDNLLHKAKSGDKDAIFALLCAHNVDAAVLQHIAGWSNGRERDIAAFQNLVNARKHYVKRGRLLISKPARIKELIEKFSLQSNVAEHIADGSGYAAVRAEAARQLAEEESSDD